MNSGKINNNENSEQAVMWDKNYNFPTSQIFVYFDIGDNVLYILFSSQFNIFDFVVSFSVSMTEFLFRF